MKTNFIRYLSAGIMLVVCKETNNIQLWNLKKMQVEAEIQNQFTVNCAVGNSDYYFIGLDNNRILVHRTMGH